MKKVPLGILSKGHFFLLELFATGKILYKFVISK